MEYQSFFLLLKSFSIENNKILATNPNNAQGYVQIKKHGQNYSVTIQINNFSNSAHAFLVSKTNIAKIPITKASTSAKIGFVIEEYASVFVFGYNLFASKNSANIERDYLLCKSVQNSKESTTLEKIFGKVHDTYFFDCIKPKLAGLFAVGKPCSQLSQTFSNSKWTMVKHNGEQMLFGVVYKDRFAYAIAVGATSNFLPDEKSYKYKIDEKTYNILFMSASNGKFISF